ncbi:hypothetical protein PAHAL_2G441400 [Panicum hallii]|uniref:Uncharacterized protein n=1 Tax=Panicum hallii TaxID=206008 RepID=A0A2T8KST8_9POAL|nr:uncharacterized protein LOC112880127 [Panicum hallii]PVH65234.1 hypothetical protein PAHAL_2G441400 [Panicum hallii]
MRSSASSMAIDGTAARKLLHGGAIARGAADLGGVSFGLWELVTGFFADILAYLFAALAGAAHLLVLPLELLWQWLVAAAAGAISSGIDGLWQHVTGLFAGIFGALAGAAHQLVLPLETLWRWLATIVTDTAGVISGGLDGLWQHVTGFFAALAGAAHQFVLPLETLWQWLATSTADAAGAISSGLDGLWQLVTGVFPKISAYIFAALAGAAHELPQKLEELWRWLKAAAAVALPFALGVAAVLLLLALIWFCGPTLCHVTVGVCRALVSAVCYFGHGLYYVAVAVLQVLAGFLPRCVLCLKDCALFVTMKAPGAADMLISRAAFEAAPALYFQILRTAGPVVAAAVFCAKTVAVIVAPPVAALFRVPVGA